MTNKEICVQTFQFLRSCSNVCLLSVKALVKAQQGQALESTLPEYCEYHFTSVSILESSSAARREWVRQQQLSARQPGAEWGHSEDSSSHAHYHTHTLHHRWVDTRLRGPRLGGGKVLQCALIDSDSLERQSVHASERPRPSLSPSSQTWTNNNNNLLASPCLECTEG